MLVPETDGSFLLDYAGFGLLTLQTGVAKTGYFQGLGYTNQTQTVLIAPNFVGLGLPENLWYQVTNLLFKIDTTLSEAITCSNKDGGICTITGACSTQSALQDYSFKFIFAGQTTYMNVPLAAFAVDNVDGNCDVYLQYLDGDQHVQSDKVVLGAMFLQLYKNYWQYDLTAGTSTLSMQLSTSCTLTGAYLGAASYTVLTDPFTDLWDTTQILYVSTDDYYFETTIGANLGW